MKKLFWFFLNWLNVCSQSVEYFNLLDFATTLWWNGKIFKTRNKKALFRKIKMSLTKSPNMTILKNLRSKIFKSRYMAHIIWDGTRDANSKVLSWSIGGTTLECNIWFWNQLHKTVTLLYLYYSMIELVKCYSLM